MIRQEPAVADEALAAAEPEPLVAEATEGEPALPTAPWAEAEEADQPRDTQGDPIVPAMFKAGLPKKTGTRKAAPP